MYLKPYTIDDKPKIERFHLVDTQLKYVKSPKINIDIAQTDNTRTPMLGLNDDGDCVVFFVLHEGSEFDHHFEIKNSIYIRSFSTDFYHQGKGYAKKALQLLPEWLKENMPHIEYITLLVDEPNQKARALYLKIGFEQGQLVQGERYLSYTMIKKIN